MDNAESQYIFSTNVLFLVLHQQRLKETLIDQIEGSFNSSLENLVEDFLDDLEDENRPNGVTSDQTSSRKYVQ